MKVSIYEANQLMGEIIKMLEHKGVRFEALKEYVDYDDIVRLIHRRNGWTWNTYRQEWVKGDSK